MRKPNDEFETVEVRETLDAIERASKFKWRTVRRTNDGRIVRTDKWVETDIPSRVEVAPRVLRYNKEGNAQCYDEAGFEIQGGAYRPKKK